MLCQIDYTQYCRIESAVRGIGLEQLLFLLQYLGISEQFDLSLCKIKKIRWAKPRFLATNNKSLPVRRQVGRLRLGSL